MNLVRIRFLSVLLGSLIFLCYPVRGHGQPPVQAGVSAALAAYRSSVLRNIVYTLHFYLPAEREAAVLTTERLTFELSDNRVPLQIDFKKKGSDLEMLHVNGTSIPLEYA